MVLRSLCIGLFVILTGCASLPPQTKAIQHSLSTDAALREATQRCTELGPAERRLAQREHSLWLKRNQEWVRAADHGLLSLHWDQVSSSGEKPRAILSMQILEGVQMDALSQVNDWFGDYTEESDCVSLFKKVAKEKMELGEGKHAELLSPYKLPAADLNAIVQSATPINARYLKFGRSLFVVEKVLKEEGCRQANIALLRNSWPLEVYDAVCTPEDYKIVQCQWGRCEVKR